MADLIDTTEMYLRTIYELEEENIFPLRARISERLGHSGPTVSQTVGRMEVTATSPSRPKGAARRCM
jgi:DtxR family Mn-dependent transcriptional regulator